MNELQFLVFKDGNNLKSYTLCRAGCNCPKLER